MVAPAFVPSWLRLKLVAGEQGGSRGCWSKLSPYVRRHPGDWCNMERFSV